MLLELVNIKKAKSSSSFAIYVGVIVTLVLSLFVLFFSNVTLNILGSTEKTNEYVLSYLKYVVVLGAVPTVFNMIIANMIRAEGFSLQASIGLSIGGILNIVLDPIFVLPFGFNMEIKGAAIATLISNVITTIYFLILLIIIRKKTTISFVPKRMFETKKNWSRGNFYGYTFGTTNYAFGSFKPSFELTYN